MKIKLALRVLIGIPLVYGMVGLLRELSAPPPFHLMKMQTVSPRKSNQEGLSKHFEELWRRQKQ